MIRPIGAALIALSATPALAAEDSEFGVLVDEPGVEETYYACTACHSEMLIAQQGLTRERWDELLDWMVEKQGMSELDPDRRETILDYLAEHYNTGRPNFPR
jgi:cytochrome c